MTTTNPQGWHADDDALRAYAEGRGLPLASASVEGHLMVCAQCRTRFAPMMDTEPLAKALEAIRSAYLLDDESESMTDVVPAFLLRRRTSRVLAGFAVLAVGGAVLAGMLQWWAPSAPASFPGMGSGGPGLPGCGRLRSHRPPWRVRTRQPGDVGRCVDLPRGTDPAADAACHLARPQP